MNHDERERYDDDRQPLQVDTTSGYHLEDGRYVGPSEQAHLDRKADGDRLRDLDRQLDDVEWGMKRRGTL